MNELKTLKDFFLLETSDTTFPKGLIEGKHIDKWINLNELKAEAVKWVKDYRKSDLERDKAVISWIKYFFNLTEEDLK